MRGASSDPGRRRPWPRILTAVAAVLAILAGALYLGWYLPGQRVDDRARAAAAQAAAEGAAALLTYTPDSVAADLSAATERLTGEYKDYYGRIVDSVIVPTARDQKISSHATVTGTGVSSFDADSAQVLVFLSQTSTSADRPQPVSNTAGAVVELSRVDGDWLISRFDVG